MNELSLSYPPESCPFCTIASAYPPPSSPLWSSPKESLEQCVPRDEDSGPDKTAPASFVVLNAEHVLAFLDILPMTRGHLLVTVREHREKVEDLRGGEAGDIGYWLPILARVVKKVAGVTDYNIVQNNGARAAQVVPHVHFHIIPRPEAMPQIKNKSWTMFGRGQRDELDDDEGASIAAEMRLALREELAKIGGEKKAKL